MDCLALNTRKIKSSKSLLNIPNDTNNLLSAIESNCEITSKDKTKSKLNAKNSESNTSLDTATIKKIKGRARRLSANTIGDNTPKKTQPTQSPYKKRVRRKTDTVQPKKEIENTPSQHSTITRFFKKSSVTVNEDKMSETGELISAAYQVLDNNRGNDHEVGSQLGPNEDMEVTFKKSTEHEQEQQNPSIQVQTSQDTEPMKQNSMKAPVDYDNMSNGDMIRLMMMTLTEHKNVIKNEIRVNTTKLLELERSQQSQKEEIKALQSQEEIQSSKTCHLEEKMGLLESQVQRLTNFAIHQDALITELKHKNEQLEVRAMKNNLVIHGIVESKKENCVEKVKSFLTDILKNETNVNLQTAYRIGRGNQQPMLIKLALPAEKGKVFKCIKNLKGVTNEEDKPYTIRDQLPPKQAADEERHKDLLKENKKNMNTPKHMTMELKGNTLHINNSVYHKLVHPPLAKDVLKASVVDQIRWRKVKCVPGNITV